MTIHYKTFPDSLDIVFTTTNPAEKKEIHTIMRKHITGYEGYRLDKTINQVEIHSQVEPSAWTMERLYKDLEDWAYGHLYPKAETELAQPISDPDDS
jgi:hypothetical protein